MNIFDAGLTPDRDNANEGTQRGRGLLEKSLRKLGAGRSILTDKAGNVIAGNKTLETAADIDLPVRIVETDGNELVVVKRTDLDLYSETDKRARQLAYADNKIAEVDLAWKPDQIAVDFEPLELKEWGFPSGDPVDYEKEWQGMPEYESENLKSFKQIIVHFANQEDMDSFSDLIGQKIPDKAKYMWYPKAEIMTQGEVIEDD